MSPNSRPEIPTLEGSAAEAVADRNGHIQIIAAAGAGKTEVVSQRVASLLADGQDPTSIVAFTFTEKAAAELKERIRIRVETLLGETATDQLGRLFVGTIHSYCFRLLQTYVPRYETYTPLDENQLVNVLFRERNRLGLSKFDENDRLFRGVANFQRTVDVVENELLALEQLPEGPFRDTLTAYYDMLDRYQFMSFGMQIVRAVEALRDPHVHKRVTASLKHLIVDEYQDVNPAQEQLIELLARPKGSADLVVVGDDDQAIYQWRGSDVNNIVSFADRYDGVKRFNLLVNRRSRPEIVELANAFSKTIPERLSKEMGTYREGDGPSVSIAAGFEDEATEADAIAMAIEKLHKQGVRYGDIAILVRGRSAYAKLLDGLDAWDIPVQPGGRTGLFEQREAALFGATYAWLAEIDWAPGRFIKREAIQLEQLLTDYTELFELDPPATDQLRSHLIAWHSRTAATDFGVSLVSDFYDLTSLLPISQWDIAETAVLNRLGTIARFSQVLADYESVALRARRDPVNPGEQVGGEVGGVWLYRNLALLLVNYSTGSYDDFDGAEDPTLDAVSLGTVHGAKGLEWPIVFIPSLTGQRFPSSKTGSAQDWLIPRDLFDADRYEGSDADERRLFYVALTRARDWLSLSSHERVTTQSVRVSPYLEECITYVTGGQLPTNVTPTGLEQTDLALTYSELAAYSLCPHSFLLRNELGFMPPLQSEMGYGNAVHHLMRVIAERTQQSGTLPKPKEVNDLLNSDFYLPFANKPAHKQMREKARRLVFRYIADHQSELIRTWATERPFELYLPGVVISGRADVIYDQHDGEAENLAIVDYKTSTGVDIEPMQLQIYADAGRREGLSIAAAFIHDMSTTDRHMVAIDQPTLESVEKTTLRTTEALKQRDFAPSPSITKCRSCDVRAVCGYANIG